MYSRTHGRELGHDSWEGCSQARNNEEGRNKLRSYLYEAVLVLVYLEV